MSSSAFNHMHILLWNIPCLLIYHWVTNHPHTYGLEQGFYFVHDFIGQEFMKDLSGWFGSDPPGVSWGWCGWRIHLQDRFFTRVWGASVLLLSFSLSTWLSSSRMSPGVWASTAWWSQGCCTLSWLPRPRVPREKEWKVLVSLKLA